MKSPTIPPEATAYLAASLCVLPARRDEKRPALRRWKQYQKRLPSPSEINGWFANGVDGTCILTGTVSGNAEMIDFDVRAELLEPWKAKVNAAAPRLMQRLFIEKTQSGGRHVVYRCEAEVSGNLKLAQRKQLVSDDEITADEKGREFVIIYGKKYVVRADADGKHVIITLIETRGEGGLFLCAPTPGYEVIQGGLCDLPVLTESERDVLLRCAWELNEHVPDVIGDPRPSADNVHSSTTVPHNGDRPGDDFNSRGDVRAVLENHGWVCVKGGENEYWRRPGKTSGTSATLKERVFYVFSSNAAPFESDSAYSPFAVFSMLDHGGDFEQAARSLRHVGYGDGTVAHNATDVDISALVRPCGPQEADSAPVVADPGPIPKELLHIPGFVNEVMDHSLETAPYPNVAMAFCGALALQAFLVLC